LLTSATPDSEDLGNARGVRFLEPQANAATGSDVNKKFYDSWTQQFTFKIDANYDGVMTGEGLDGFTDTNKLYTTISIISGGPDESISATNDNVNSWESK
jgi:hypothetical protein